MSEVHYKSQPLSRSDIRHYAKKLRKNLLLEDAEYIDVIRLAEYIFPVLFKKYGFSFEVMPQEIMGNNHGLTNPQSGQIFIREDVYDGACCGGGRDRLTIAHELGHFLLHDGVTLGLARTIGHEPIPTYCDPEWQATAFAGEFLMDHDIIAHMTVDEIVDRCKVSFDAARYQKLK